MQNRKQKLIILAIASLFLIAIVTGQIRSRANDVIFAYNETESTQVIQNGEIEPEGVKNEIMVHIAGAVQKPGVYTLTEGQRIEDALQKAGVLENSDIDALNRAALLVDGQKIVVPYKNNSDDMAQIMDDGLININQADLQQLMTLPGIGEAKANAILSYRAQYGGFSRVEDIQKVSGIGEAIYSQIKDKIKI